MTQLPLSVTILTKNSQKYLREVLQALTDFDEVVVCDTGSNDATMDIAREFSNVTLYEKPFRGFGPSHNEASQLARNDWIFSVDSDEIATPELINEIRDLSLQRNTLYAVSRLNEYKGTAVKWCGWYPDYQFRIYNRHETQFTDAQVHESLIVTGMKVVKLKNFLRHYSYANTADFLSKLQSYSDLFAQQNQGKKHSSISKAFIHGCFAFIKSFIIKRGFMGGAIGLEISIYNANSAFYKYLKLAEKNQERTS